MAPQDLGLPSQDSRREVAGKRYRHRLVGDLTLDCDTWSSPDGSGQRLRVLTAEPGTPSYDALRILASWGTGQPSLSH
ncbi:hypothetical protein GCM10009850_075680 [Nonomuraea monospora]|uniref:MmyB-like transcription regulator ligand binding domain-containing protein n=1 Tax=Nonomuraea monospora TaxID=568818 RepID=A0ABN3CRN2_9ACTN